MHVVMSSCTLQLIRLYCQTSCSAGNIEEDSVTCSTGNSIHSTEPAQGFVGANKLSFIGFVFLLPFESHLGINHVSMEDDCINPSI